MKHPQRDEWVPFLFGEANPESKQRLSQHLQECPDCAREIAGWRRSLRQLNRWTLPKNQLQVIPLFQPVLKWAMAAAIILGLGMWIGRFSAPPINEAKLRGEIETSLRSAFQEELNVALREAKAETANRVAYSETRAAESEALERQQLWSRFLDVLGAARTEDNRAVQALFREYQKQHGAEFVALRKDLETLASMTDEQIRQARLNLVQLAAAQNSVQ